MRISGFIWSEVVVDKLAWKHGIQIAEVVEIFENAPHFERMERGHRHGEDLYVASGQTFAGRYLVVLFIRKQAGKALIVTARDMTQKERRRYAER
jgi:uncharacterized DUF497 family protein